MNILITGCAGYVGSVLTGALLKAGHCVTGVDILRFGSTGLLSHLFHEHFEFHRLDICDAQALAKLVQGKDAIVHLAAVVGDPASKREPELTRRVNLEGTRNLVDLAVREKVPRFVFFSTCSNYGLHDASELATEESDLNPVSLYAETKVEAERYLLQRSGNGLCGTVMRCATVYGFSPRMRFDLTVNHFTRDSFIDKKLKVYGEDFWRPYIHVEDLAAAVLEVLASKEDRVRGQVFNTGNTAENYQKRTIAEIIHEKLPETKVEYVKVDEDPRNYKVDFSKIRKGLDFQTRHTLPDGVDQVILLLKNQIITNPRDPIYSN